MTEIKEDFQNWLIKQENHKTSARQVVQSINNVCQNFFNGDTNEHWLLLTKNILSILIYYHECNNKEYCISINDGEILKNHLNKNLLQYIRVSSDYKKDIFPDVQLSLVYKSKKFLISTTPLNCVPEHIDAYCFIVNQLTENNIQLNDLSQLYGLAKLQNIFFGDLSAFFDKMTAVISDNSEILNKPYIFLHLQYNEKASKQEAKALLAFYKYLTEKSLINSDKESLHLGYDELENLIVCINKVFDNLMKLITTEQFTGRSSKKIKAHNGKKYLYHKEVAEALECSVTVSRKLKKQGVLLPIKKNGRLFSVDSVNKLLETALHKVTYEGVDYTLSIPLKDKLRQHPEIWCTRAKAAKILKLNVSTIDSYKKENVLTYIEIVPNSAVFYIPELKRVAQIVKMNPTRCLDSLKRLLRIKSQ